MKTSERERFRAQTNCDSIATRNENREMSFRSFLCIRGRGGGGGDRVENACNAHRCVPAKYTVCFIII